MQSSFKWIVVTLITFLIENNSTFAQVSFYFNQSTEAARITGEWNPGDPLYIYVENYDSATFNYKIEYSSSEEVNTSGLAILNAAGAEKIGLNAVSPAFLYMQCIIENKDVSHIHITKYANKAEVYKRTFSFRVKRGLKLDVSTGIFGTNLINEEYVLVSEDSQKRIVKENSGDYTIGTGILAHLHGRRSSSVNPGISMGFELNNQAKVSYLLGFSALIGYDKKFIFTTGFATSQKKVISNAYAEGQLVDSALTEVPRVDIWKTGMFIALTYNF